MPAFTQLGTFLENARERRGLTQAQAAQRAGVTVDVWQHVVTGYQDHNGTLTTYYAAADVLLAMADAVGVTSPELRYADRSDVADVMQDRELAIEENLKTPEAKAEFDAWLQQQIASRDPAADAAMDAEIRAKYAGKTNRELLDECGAIAREITEELLRRKGLL